jgi:hypothetical protein
VVWGLGEKIPWLPDSAVLTIGLYIVHFDNQEVNFDHQMQSECTGTYFAAPLGGL